MNLKGMRFGRWLDDESGVTLIELLVVLAIMGLLAGLATPIALNIIDNARIDTARIDIQRTSSVIDLYSLHNGRPPSSDQGLQALITKPNNALRWQGPYLAGGTVPLDPWGQPYGYDFPSKRPGKAYDLYSLGADGAPGGEGADADIYN